MSHSSGRDLFIAVKRTAVRTSPTLSLPVGRPVAALLRPVATASAVIDAQDVQSLTKWRNRFVSSFLTEFESTEDRTRQWLANTVGPDDTRILFMVDDPEGRTIGYMGLAFIDWTALSGEADAIVRGGDAPKGIMTAALRTLLCWATGQLGLRQLSVRVRSDNTALSFYRKFGFEEVKRVPLRRSDHAGMVQWVEDVSFPLGEPSLVHMRLPQRAILPS